MDSYALVGFDGDPVAFTWEQIQEIPYASDILTRGNTEPLPATAIAGRILLEVQKLLRLKQVLYVALEPRWRAVTLGPFQLKNPPICYTASSWDDAVNDWPQAFLDALGAYSVDDLILLLRAFGFLCMYGFRRAIAYRLLWLLYQDAHTQEVQTALRDHEMLMHLLAFEYTRSLKMGADTYGEITAATASRSSSNG
jgi:hypothetical protein